MAEEGLKKTKNKLIHIGCPIPFKHDIFWPQQETDRWQIMQKHFSSNILTYWKNFTGFDSMTLSESNTRIRTFLNLDFSESRTENEITLETSEKGDLLYSFVVQVCLFHLVIMQKGGLVGLAVYTELWIYKDGCISVTSLDEMLAAFLKREEDRWLL